MGIPKRFHRILVMGYDVGEAAARWWQDFERLHPGWELTTWTDPVDPRDFELGYLFTSCQNGAQLADVLRLELVWRHGGFYVDADIEPLRPFDALLEHRCVFGTENGIQVTNAVIGAEAGHPALRAVMDRLLEYDALPPWLRPNESTGPHLYTQVFEHRDDVLILPAPVFYPYGPEPDGTPEPPSRHALCIHHWARSWADPPDGPQFGRGAKARRASLAAVRDKVLQPLASRVRRVPAERMTMPLSGAYVGNNRVLISTRAGFPLYAIADDQSITPQLMVHGWSDKPLGRLIDRVLRPGDWFVDIGANVGLFTVAAARRVGPQGRVIAYEPNLELAKTVEANAAMNWLQNVMVLACSVGSVRGRRAFENRSQYPRLSVAASRNHPSPSLKSGYESLIVPVESVDERIPAGAPVRLVKIDVKGGEAEVLAGMSSLISRAAVDYITLRVIRRDSASDWRGLVRQLRELETAGAEYNRLRHDGTTTVVALDELVTRGGVPQVVIDLTALPVK